MITIEEVKNRQVLNEGRSMGMGFALLKKIEKNHYQTVNPISPCKDYLAEVVFTENTGLPTQGCGLNYTAKENILTESVSYMVIVNQKNKSGNFSVESKTFEQYGEEIKNGIKNIENFINVFQNKLGEFIPCKIEEANDNMYLVTFDTAWTVSTHSISLFALLLRNGKNYNGENPLEYLNNIPESCIDYYPLKSAIGKITIVYESKKLPLNTEEHITQAKNAKLPWSPHSLGISNWSGVY